MDNYPPGFGFSDPLSLAGSNAKHLPVALTSVIMKWKATAEGRGKMNIS